jgi:hypothetical protein
VWGAGSGAVKILLTMVGVSDPPGEQLTLFPYACDLPPPQCQPRPTRRRTVAGTASNDMALVAEVLGAADNPGYLVEDTAAGTRIWRASGPVDARRELPLLESAERDEAAMVAQLLARRWLHRGARTQTRAAVARGRSSGRRRFDVEVHALTVPTLARHTLARWSALAAVPTQHPDPQSS